MNGVLPAGDVRFTQLQGIWHPTLDALADSLAVLDQDGVIVAVNRAWETFGTANGGGEPGAGVGASYVAICDRAAAKDATAAELAAAVRDIAGGRRAEYSCVYPCHSPTEERWFSLRVALLPDAAPRHLIVTHHDVTALHRARQLAEERVAMERRLRSATDLRDAVLQTMPDGLLVLDCLGRVTLVNEAAEQMLGRPRGELLGADAHEELHAVAAEGGPPPVEQRLHPESLPTNRTVRVEDDVFRRRDGTMLPVSFSVAPFTSEFDEQGWVVVFNDIAERKARELEVRRELDELTWVGRIRDALEQDRFVLHAQPIVDVASGEIVQHELLIRMLGPDGQLVPPGAFLPVAEEHGLIRAIDRHVLVKAFAHAAAGHPVQVNLSADSIGDPTLFGFVQDELEAQGVDPRMVVFEITETALIHNEAAAQVFTEAVVELGCDVALDDFGTGYRSFHYLKHLPVGHLKIDREFVRDLDGEPGGANRHVITAIVSLARAMGKLTVAEGVETGAELAAMRELGVDRVQGYFFARPAPVHEVFSSTLQRGG